MFLEKVLFGKNLFELPRKLFFVLNINAIL